MKIINSLILLLMVLMMTSSVLAACPSNMVSYWNFDDSMDDDFNDNSLDSTIWTTEGSGSTSETGGKLNFASTSAGGQVISGAKNTALLKGDFDVQVDFSDLSGLTNSWDVAWLYVYTGDWSTGYSAYIGREYRGSQRMLSNVRKVGVDSETAVANSQTSGSYRITRSGSTVNIYYDNSGWQLLKTDSSFTTADLNVKLDLILQNTGSASIKFDNFKIVNGEPTTDSDGNNDGIISGATSTTGQLGSALDFDGSDDYVEVTGDPIGSYPYSISAWVKTSIGGGDILTIGDINVETNYHFLGINGDGYAIILDRDVSQGFALGTTVVSNGAWHHVVGVVSASNDRKIYVDGNLENSDTTTIAYAAGTDSMAIGRLQRATPLSYLNGQLDEVAIYNTALTATQVAELYEASANQGLDYCADFSADTSAFTTGTYDGSELNATDLTLGDGSSQILWTDEVNILGKNLSEEVTVGAGFVSVNVAAIPSLNTTANVQLTVDGCENVAVYYADSYQTTFDSGSPNWALNACSGGECTITSCVGTTLSLSVTHFDGWGGEGDPPSAGVPEFNLLGILLILVVAGLGMYLISKRQ